MTKTMHMDDATKHMTLRVNVRLRGVRLFKVRMKIAAWLLRFTAWVMRWDLDLKLDT